jgi:hypothetical protein
MEPEDSSPCSQQPSTGPYPEPDRHSPHHRILSKIYFNIVHPPTSKYVQKYVQAYNWHQYYFLKVSTAKCFTNSSK